MLCLNCNNEASGNYCSYCGQKTSVRRFSLKHLVTHEFVHGVFHLQKGFLFTIKSLFTRPGHFTREYIQGKRIRYFHFLTLIIIIAGVDHYLGGFSKIEPADLVNGSSNVYSEMEIAITNWEKDNPKTAGFVMIPFFAMLSYLCFKKSEQNFAEHLVLNSFLTAGTLIISLFFTTLTVIYEKPEFLKKVSSIISFFTMIYIVWFYFQYFSAFGYKKRALIFRSILVLIATFLIIGLIGAIPGIVDVIIKR